MPHFGLMDADSLGAEEWPLMRAKLHIRAGKRRLRQGKVSAGIVTLYDALDMALQWYITSPERRRSLTINEGDNLRDEKVVYKVLVYSGILDGSFDIDAFYSLVERSLEGELAGFDYSRLLESIEAMMTKLGVMPFDEGELPPEDPSTF